jgi:UDP-N-acetylmuramoyl-L-alanyl-D-glutamate--2,6-diaminopimelate ligase
MEVMTREGIQVILLDDLEEAIQLGLKKVLKGDLLLLAGCQGMDFGGEIALHQLVEMYPDQPKDQLLAPLKHRVCGISDLN